MSKIAILSFYSGIVERGVETFALEIAARLTKDHQVTVIHSGPSRNFLTDKQKLPRISFKQINSFARRPKSTKGPLAKIYLDVQSLKIFLFTLKSIKEVLKERYHALILLNGGWQVAILRIVTKILKIKIIIPGEAGIGSDDAWNLLFRPDVFVALTASQTQWAKRLAPEVKIVTIPNGVDLAKFNPKVKAKNIDLEKPLVICTSALVPYKRVDLTIKAIAKTNNLSLLILGDGELRGATDSLGKRLLGKRYRREIIPYKQIPAYYRAGNVFTLASKTEAFGSSYIEAMACNLPVVTTNDNSRAEIIGRAGILTDPQNLDLYAKDLMIAASTNYRNIPYDQSLKYSWNKVAKNYSDLIINITKVKNN